MFNISQDLDSNLITLSGNFDSSRSDDAKKIFQNLTDSVTIDMSDLDFICSAGIGILVMTYRQLKEKEKLMTLVNLKPHIRKVFEVSLLHKVFDIK